MHAQSYLLKYCGRIFEYYFVFGNNQFKIYIMKVTLKIPSSKHQRIKKKCSNSSICHPKLEKIKSLHPGGQENKEFGGQNTVIDLRIFTVHERALHVGLL
jgi:hypothetical protein